MSQINLDTSPYFDDFNENKDYYKVLFKPGFPVQARELTTLQSILQNQISNFGEHFFKEGSMVIPGAISYNPQYTAVILKPQQGGIDVSLYLEQLVGNTLIGEVSGVRAKVIDFLIPPSEGIENPTIYVTYSDSGTDDVSDFFSANESLITEEPVVYGNTTITANSAIGTTVEENATAVGSAAQIADGVYFVRGTFAQVRKSRVILEPYVNTPSYRVGLQITEQIVTAGQDETLYDNAKGFNNYSAPGADRLKLTLTLIKKPLNDYNDTSFVELLKVQDGELKKLEEQSNYNIIKDYIAARTYDESGDYVVNGLNVSVDECLNDGLGNGGVYKESQLTEQGNEPSEDLATIKVSSGKAYVRGYDVSNPGTVNIDTPKPRTTDTVGTTAVPFEMGSQYIVNNVSGTPAIGLDKQLNIARLYNARKDGSTAPGEQIGEARVYSFSLEDSPYVNESTPWELYLYDVQIFTKITTNVDPSTVLSEGFRIKGLSSNATGFVRSLSGNDVYVTEVSGEFKRGERLSINGNTTPSISSSDVEIYSQSQVKSIFQASSSVDAQIPGGADFSCDTLLYGRIQNGFTASDSFRITDTGTVTCPGRRFTSFKPGDVILWQDSASTQELVNVAKVDSLSGDQLSMNVSALTSVPNVCNGDLPTTTVSSVNLRASESRLLNTENSFLYAQLEENNVSSTNLANSSLIFTAQITNQTVTNSQLTANVTGTDVLGARFVAFDQERYSVIYSDGVIEPVSSSQVTLVDDSREVRFTGLSRSNASNVVVNATAVKPSIRSKTKILVKSQKLLIDKVSAGIGTEDFGVIENPYYGLRVDDEEISLNVADVESITAVLESLDAGDPVLDFLTFVNGLDLDVNAIVGEQIIGQESGAISVIVDAPTPATIRIVRISQAKYQIGERVLFSESEIETNLQSVTEGNYNNITDKFTLDKGQREQFYDFSRLVRVSGVAKPNKKILVIYNQFQVPVDDKGDFYTANSYSEDVFATGVPLLANNTLRASDTLDFRPRVAPFTATNASPFAYISRNFETSGSTTVLVTAPNESMTLGFDFYVGRRDRIVLDTQQDFKLIKGAPAALPQLPAAAEAAIELARIEYPPYVYDINDIKVVAVDNRRYTMRDIGKLEDRIENLEEITSLSLLERETESLQVVDADGVNRFKSGFFADDFKDTSFIDFDNPECTVAVNQTLQRIQVLPEISTVPLTLQLEASLDRNAIDTSVELPLIDPSTTKAGDLVTLNYNEVQWITQPLCSRIENVNPFNVILYTGTMTLRPASDDFVITRNIGNRRINIFGSTPQDFTRTFVEGIEVAQFMRERNVGFAVENIRPHTRFFPFFEGSSGVDVVPKLIQIRMESGTFQVGETVRGFNGSSQVFASRVAQQNHKTGPFDLPTRTFATNPYDRTSEIPEDYSSATSVLNIDTNSLADSADGRFFGLVANGVRLVGESSGAVARVEDVQLVSDAFGELFGAIYFRDPYANPAPAFRLRTGIRTFRISSSPTNEIPALGETIISFAEALYESSGTVQNRRTEQVSIRELPPPPPPVIIDRTVTNNFTDVIDRTVTQVIDRTVTIRRTINRTIDRTRTINRRVVERERRERERRPREVPRRFRRDDPLAQTFRVDETGAFLTSVEIFMASKSLSDNLTVEIRPTELATPVDFLIQDFAQVVLSPDQVNVSEDGSVGTLVTFPSPIYLEPDITYALVLLAPTTDEYTAWIARMGETNVGGIIDVDFDAGAQEGDTLNNSAQTGTAIISQQYLNGSLFKSQNGSIWTANQFEDLKFTLFKAEFETDGAVFLTNPDLFNSYSLINNPFTTLPREIGVSILPSSYNFTVGEKIAATINSASTDILTQGEVKALGGAAVTLSVTSPGIGFIPGSYTGVELTTIDSDGINAIASFDVDADGKITSATITSGGSGYAVGDTLRIDTSTILPVDAISGGDDVLTVATIGDTDTIFLTKVQGIKIEESNILKSVGSDGSLTIIPATVDTKGSVVNDPMYSGKVFVIDAAAHGMEDDTNVMTIVNALPDTPGSPLTGAMSLSDNQLFVADGSLFDTFEGISTSVGYLYVGGEIMEYEADGSNTLTITDRGVDSSAINIHDVGERAFKYEISGISLRRINTKHSLPNDSLLGNTRDFIRLPMEILTPDRPGLSFNQEQSVGGNSAFMSENIQYDAIFPSVSLLTPGSATQIEASIRTVSGTSDGGSEISFVDQGSQPVVLNDVNRFLTPRLVASKVNEVEYLQDLPDNKSLILALTFRSTDPNLSPVIDINQAALITQRNSLNKPITDYATDPRVNQVVGDPHASAYISQRVNITNPATSLKIVLSAYRNESADFRVLYRLFAADTQGSTEPSWVLFPGYNNMLDTDGDGFGDQVIDPSKNNGLPNKEVRGSRRGPDGFREQLEYTYEIDDLPEFSGFQVKIVFSGTNEAEAPFIYDIRGIALA